MTPEFLLPIRNKIRWNLTRAAGSPLSVKKQIAVMGIPRSGTSWLAKALSLTHGVNYSYEPDRLLRHEYRYRFLPRDTCDSYLKNEISQMLAGNIAASYQIDERDLRDIFATRLRSTVLVKWVWLCHAAHWIAAEFQDLHGVHLIRHPAPLMLSRRARGWNVGASLDILLRQPALMDGPLMPFAPALRKITDEWEKAGAFWAATVSLQMRSIKDSPRPKQWTIREHEWFCLSPESRLHQLTDQLNLKWSNKVAKFLDGRSKATGAGYQEWRDPVSEVNKWRKSIKPEELNALQRGIEPFSLPFYPDLDPEAHVSETLFPF